MNSTRDLRIVSWLFIISGVSCLVAPLFTSRFEIGTGLLGIPAGIGLLRFRRGWRTFALLSISLGFAALLVIVVILLSSQHVTVNLFGWRPESRWAYLVFLIPALLVMLWEYRVLTRAEVRGWFQRGSEAAA